MRIGARLSGLALIASPLSGTAAAQEPALEMRLVQAFQTYCMASAADAKRVPDLHDFYQNSGKASGWTTKGRDLVITKEPYSRVRILFDEPPDTPTRTCSVDVTPTLVDKQLVLASLERDLGLGAGTSAVLPELTPKVGGSPRGPRPKTDLTVWQTRVDDTEAEGGAAPRLTLSVRVSGR